jgi:histidinol-phosphate aminotransferase
VSELPLRDELRGARPYGAPELRVPIALNVNENPYGPSPDLAAEIAAVVADVAGSLNRYPDREAVLLRDDLARYLGHGLTRDRVWAGNGSNEVMLHVLQAFGGPGRSVLSFAPTYSMYPEYARSTATRWIAVERPTDFVLEPDALVSVIEREQPTVTLLASPNNPTGTALSLAAVEAVCQASKGIVVVDEAYAEFRRPGVPSALSLLERYPSLAVTRTMSKAFGLAGLRVGYLAGSPALVDALRLVRLPYHLSAVTQAIARVALAHADELLTAVAQLRTERDALVDWLRQQGFEVPDSDANFVLFGRFADPHEVWQRLLARGVLIRETSIPGWLRVSVGTPEEMAGFRSALVALDAVPREEAVT